MGGPGPYLGTQRSDLPGSLRTSWRRLTGPARVQEATSVGLTVVGFDIGQGVVDGLNSGRSHIDDLSDADVQRMVDAGFRATTSEAEIGEPDTIVICVPTPLSEADGPDLAAGRAGS